MADGADQLDYNPGLKVNTQRPVDEAVGKPCPYCDRIMSDRGLPSDRRFPTREHLLSRSRGGRLSPENRLIVCARCNEDKGDRTLAEWAAFLISLKEQDWPRLERVVGIILDIYEELGDEVGNQIVHGTGRWEPETGEPIEAKKRRCRFPACGCVARCSYKYEETAVG